MVTRYIIRGTIKDKDLIPDEEYTQDMYDDWPDIEKVVLATDYDVLQQRCARLTVVVEKCVEKLRLYRQHGTGEYRGGMEYTALIAMCEQALAADPTQDNKEAQR